MMTIPKWSLVFSGGGAKGAYQVGVMRYLAEQHIDIAAVSGASIGALNGAIVATAPSTQEAYQHLNALWDHIAAHSPLKINPLFLIAKFATKMAPHFQQPISYLYDFLNKTTGQTTPSAPSLFDDAPIAQLIEQACHPQHFETGLPFWLAMYRSQGKWLDLARVLIAELGITDTDAPIFQKIQDLPRHERLQALLASAAIPFAFEQKTVQGQRYADGGIGGWQKQTGNTPIQPLLQAGYRHILVIHLQDGSFWQAPADPSVHLIEIRPSGIAKQGLQDLLSFSQENISAWKEQGYQDAKRILGEAFKLIMINHESHQARAQRNRILTALHQDGFHID